MKKREDKKTLHKEN